MGNYTLADYERDRKKAAATVSNQMSGTLTGGSIIANLRPNYSNGGYVPYVEGLSNGNVTTNVPTPVTPSTPGFNQGTRPTTGSAAPSTNPSTVTPVGNAGSVQPVIGNGAGTESGTSVGTESGEETGLTQQQVNSAIVTSDTKAKADNVLQELYDMLNKGFTYNEKESPLYAILQQQAAKEARIASGRAYSRAVANAGGFGSSYATLAAEEASRQVMEGWNDNQLALYQAAQEEWNNKFSSKVDMYNFLNAQYQQELAEKNAADSLFTSAVSALRSSYGITYDEAAMTADLQAMGLNDEQIKSALENQKQYSEAMKNSSITAQSAIEALRGKYGEDEYNEEQMRLYLGSLNYSDEAINEALSYWKQYSDTVNETKEPEKISDTAQDVLAEWQAEYGATYSEGLMRAFFAGRGYSEEAINEAVNAQRDVAKGELMDAFAKVKTYQDAATYGERLNEARRSKIISDSEWENAMRKNSEILRREYVGAGSLSAEALDEAAEMVRDQIMTKSDFEGILKNIFEDKLEDVKKEIGKKFNNLDECKEVMKLVVSLFEFVDDGTLNEDDLKTFITPFRENSTFTAFMNKMQKIEGDDDTIDRLDKEKNSDYKRAWTLIKDAMGLSS